MKHRIRPYLASSQGAGRPGLHVAPAGPRCRYFHTCWGFLEGTPPEEHPPPPSVRPPLWTGAPPGGGQGRCRPLPRDPITPLDSSDGQIR